MSELIVKVWKIDQIIPHPNADKLDICLIGGWKSVVRKGQFKIGQKVVFFPPECILPPELANGPEDDPPGRLNVSKYCAPLPKDEYGIPEPGGRVKATRLRGEPSFGVVMTLDSRDPDWAIGEDVASYYGIKKWEPPFECTDGDADKPHVRFHKYTDIESIYNFPNSFQEGEEVIFTEKIHGKNARLGLILDADESGNATWNWMAGSHSVRRKEHVQRITRFNALEMIERGVLKEDDIQANHIFDYNGDTWKILQVIEKEDKTFCKAVKVDKDGEPILKISDFWQPFDIMRPLLKGLLNDVVTQDHSKTPSIIVFGEIFGPSVQDMAYGLKKPSFRAFDIAVDFEYLDFPKKDALFGKYDVPTVPILYRGPFSMDKVYEYTSGNTTLCDPKNAGKFKGREGIVITPVKERICPIMNKRLILKSVSADYLDRNKIKGYEVTDGH